MPSGRRSRRLRRRRESARGWIDASGISFQEVLASTPGRAARADSTATARTVRKRGDHRHYCGGDEQGGGDEDEQESLVHGNHPSKVHWTRAGARDQQPSPTHAITTGARSVAVAISAAASSNSQTVAERMVKLLRMDTIAGRAARMAKLASGRPVIYRALDGLQAESSDIYIIPALPISA